MDPTKTPPPRRPSCRVFALVLLSAVFCSPVHADEFRLTDGRVVVGKVVKRDGVYEVTTRHGVVRIPEDNVVSQRSEAELLGELRRLAKRTGKDAFSQLSLAKVARDYGLEQPMWQHLDRALSGLDKKPSRAVRNHFEQFVATLEPEVLPLKWRRASIDIRVRKLMDRVKTNGSPALKACVLELLVREQGAEQDLRVRARSASRTEHRLLAIEALQRRRSADNLKFVFRTAVVDKNSIVRDGAMDLVKREGKEQEAVHYLAPGLFHHYPKVRTRTARAFLRLAHMDAVEILVKAGPAAHLALAAAQPGTRAHVAFLEQQAYVRDFDVEVAQASFIADPKIDVLQSGTVLDATVLSSQTIRINIIGAYRKALRGLAGSDPGANPLAWGGWLADLRAASKDRRPTTGKRGS